MKKRSFYIALSFLTAFVIWTIAIRLIDVEPIGPRESAVGFATVNAFVHNLTGVHMQLYVITDWLGLVPVAFGMGFALLGLMQWIKRKRILKVDRSILVLGCFYIVTVAVYLFFERFVINYRPVLIDGFLEASYPSSTTLLVLCFVPTTIMQLRLRVNNPVIRNGITALSVAFILFMVVCRLLAGVHWLTDIVGGILLSAGLVMMYDSIMGGKNHE